MTVQEMFNEMSMLIVNGHACKDLVFEDVRSGDTGNISVSGTIKTVTGHEEMGCLCEYNVGDEYVPVYCDH